LRNVIFLLLAASLLSAKPSQLQLQRQQIKNALHIPDPLPELRDKLYGQFTAAPDVVADRISFETEYKLRIPALVYHKPGATIVQHPALVVVNPRDMDKSFKYAWWAGILYARSGAIVLTYDSLGQYERNSKRQSYVDEPDKSTLGFTASSVTDVLQAVNYLASRKDVDPKRIAVLGFDAGDVISQLACALDATIYACVLPTGSVNEAVNKALAPQGDPASTLDELLAKRPILTGSAEKNQLAYCLTRPVAVWLEEKLKFPDWTKKQVLALGESNENGLVMLGPAIAPVARDDLRAVPDAVWAGDQESYIYESWRERSRAAVAAYDQ
jgi:hypothetical protein